MSGAPIIPGQPNTIQVIAWNAEGYLASRGADLVWTPAAATATDHQPEFYAIVAGISDYAAPQLALRFAAKDAGNMAEALELGARRLFGARETHITLLSTAGEHGALAPTKENFQRTFADIAKKAKPWDILVVYLAGHGVALAGTEDIYLYPTSEARTLDGAALADPEVRKRTTVSSEELVEWTKSVPALKQVLVLDTCAAGAAAARLVEQRSVSSDQIRAIERLKDRTGFHVLMGSAADSVSYEASRYGQGLLTYALLQAMKGARLREGEYVDVSELFQYAADEVPQLARNIGGIQRPVIAAPRGGSFDIGLMKSEDQERIPLARLQPLLLRPVLINPEQGFDDLQLMSALRKRIQEQSYATSRSQEGPPIGIYVDAEEMPGAIRPSGTYVVSGNRVTVSLNLVRDNQRLLSFQVSGARTELDGLVQEIVLGISANLKKVD
jgi:Caspase domain